MNRIAARQLAVLEACHKANVKRDRLREAAPELLAALRDLVEQVVNYANNDDAELPDLYQAETAIAQAEGRE